MKKVQKSKFTLGSAVKGFFTRERIEHIIEAITIALIAGMLVQLFSHLLWS